METPSRLCGGDAPLEADSRQAAPNLLGGKASFRLTLVRSASMSIGAGAQIRRHDPELAGLGFRLSHCRGNNGVVHSFPAQPLDELRKIGLTFQLFEINP